MARIYRSNELPAASAHLGRDLFEEFPETSLEGREAEGEQIEEVPNLDALREEVLAEARAEAEQKVREAYEEGLRRGEAAGEAAFRERVGEAAEAIEAAADAMRQAREDFLARLEGEVTLLARSIAERVTRRECQMDAGLVARLARLALENLVDEEDIRLRIHPEDRAALEEQRVTLLQQFPGVRRLRIEEDETVERGGCVADTRAFHGDFQPSALLDNLMDDIFGGDHAAG